MTIFELCFPFSPSSNYSHLFSETLVTYEVTEKQLHAGLIEDIKSLEEAQRSLMGFSVNITCHSENEESNLKQR